jgi:hypothetical protein
VSAYAHASLLHGRQYFSERIPHGEEIIQRQRQTHPPKTRRTSEVAEAKQKVEQVTLPEQQSKSNRTKKEQRNAHINLISFVAARFS